VKSTWLRWLRLRRIDGHDITCRQVVGLVTAYLDGELTRGQRALFEAHLAECEHCTEHLHQIRATVAVTGQLRDEDLDPRVRADLVSLYRRWSAESHA
jgi:anti-sigma factor RsiW